MCIVVFSTESKKKTIEKRSSLEGKQHHGVDDEDNQQSSNGEEKFLLVFDFRNAPSCQRLLTLQIVISSSVLPGSQRLAADKKFSIFWADDKVEHASSSFSAMFSYAMCHFMVLQNQIEVNYSALLQPRLFNWPSSLSCVIVKTFSFRDGRQLTLTTI